MKNGERILAATPEEFRAFIDALHLQLGEGSFRQLQQMVSDRMEHVGLQHDQNALAVAVDIVRIWEFGRSKRTSRSTF